MGMASRTWRWRSSMGLSLFFWATARALLIEREALHVTIDSPNPLAVGDFNGDGKLDLAVGVSSLMPFLPRQVTILFGAGTGFFSSSNSFAVGVSGESIALAAGDFNGDGKLDLVVTNGSSSNVSILLGTGTGSFGAATNFAVGSGPRSVAVADFNGDGKLDLAVANAAATMFLFS